MSTAVEIDFVNWVMQNKDWVFSGVGVALLAGLTKLLTSRKGEASPPPNAVTVTNNVLYGGSVAGTEPLVQTREALSKMNKNNTRILFVDDDTRFRVVKILKTAGWPHVKILKDISSLDAPELMEASILFLDIQGVGKALHFSDEGLGLALAIKGRYPDKKLVIYSSQPTGDRFHAALRAADATLAKNADPYQFINLVETLTSN